MLYCNTYEEAKKTLIHILSDPEDTELEKDTSMYCKIWMIEDKYVIDTWIDDE
jgi:hypothetical protein